MTQKDIAEKLGISVSTVSRVLNNIPKACSPALKEEIWKLALESGYQFNESARALKSNAKLPASSAENLQINFISFWEKSTEDNKNRFYDNVLFGIEKEVLNNGYRLNCINYADYSKISDIFKETSSIRDPFIILGWVPQEMKKHLNLRYSPHVQIALNTNCEKIDNVLCNGYAAAENAAEYLHWCGHRYILYIGKKNNEIRYYGFFNKLENLHLPTNTLSCITTDLTVAGGYRAVEIFLNLRKRSRFHQRVSAIFCANDNIAIGAYKRFKEENIRIPEDISIISVDDIQESSYLVPRLTTMSIPQVEMGSIAVQIIKIRLNKTLRLPVKVQLPVKMELRDSVKDLNNHSPRETQKYLHQNLIV